MGNNSSENFKIEFHLTAKIFRKILYAFMNVRKKRHIVPLNLLQILKIFLTQRALLSVFCIRVVKYSNRKYSKNLKPFNEML